ncbi:hypothetical protein [Brachyspira hyodysenteriae]|uniref:hypothetical protein n=1 Tax=Brachyspira hyodysenteriae TaxID=159 RepID=UPI000A156D56|nr:hypothetical protein [Brachyspira hyodysenteriae]
MKIKKLFLKIYVFLLVFYILTLIIFSILGNKYRIGYLGEFAFDENTTLKLNGLLNIKDNFIIGGELDENSIKNFIFTNESITNYSYSFRVKYYDKVFRNSDIYGVYLDTNKILIDNNFIKEIEIGRNGSPFGNLISSRIIKEEKIDSIRYNLKVKKTIVFVSLILLILIPLTIYFFIKRIRIHNIFYRIIIEKSQNININESYLFIFIVVFPFIIFVYQSMYSSFTYYYAWDSTHIYALDILLNSSGIIPTHFLHPNMFPFLLTKYIFVPFANLMDIISINNIYMLENSLNPYIAYSEFANYILSVFRYFFLLFTVFMYINILKILKLHEYISNKVILSLISLFVMIISSIFVNSIFINNVVRYESLGLLLSSISLYFIILSSETENIYNFKHKFYLSISGFFIGAAILSKILLIFFAVLIYFTYLILNIDKYKDYINNKYSDIKFDNIFIILLTTTVFLIFINIFIYINYLNKENFILFLNKIENKHFIIFLQCLTPSFFLILSIFIYMIKTNKIILYNNIKLLIYNSSLFVIFLFYVIFTSFLLRNGNNIFIDTYMYSFMWGNSLFSLFREKEIYLYIFASIMIVVTIISIININKIIKLLSPLIEKKMINIILSLLLIPFCIVSYKILRNDEKDSIISFSIIILSFFIIYKNIINISKYKKYLIYILFIITGIYSGYNIYNFVNYNKYLSNNGVHVDKSSFIYDQDAWKNAVFGPSGLYYFNIIKDKYKTEESWNTAFYWARNAKQVRRLLKQVEITNNSLLDTIVANKDSIISKDKKEIISKINDNLKGGLILPLTDNINNIYLRLDYDFYFISDIDYKKYDKRIILIDYDFYIDEKKYFVYKLDIKDWREDNNLFPEIKFNVNFKFIKNEDFNKGFILINDRLAKGL